MKAPVSRAGAPAGTWVHCLHWQLLRVVTLACSLTLYAPAQGPTERPWSEASIWGRLHFLWSKRQGGWVMGEKARIPPGPPPHHAHRLQHLDENSHQVLAGHTGDASGEFMAL